MLDSELQRSRDRAHDLAAVTRDLDAPVTLLAELIPSVLHCPDWDDLMQRIMKNPDIGSLRLVPTR